jgi:GT2 family glycosyltransferase
MRSIRSQEGVRWELLIVDNCSSDGTQDVLRGIPEACVTFNSGNVGFGTAHNQNARRARGRHILFLNPDVSFGCGLFAGLTAALDQNTACAIAGPHVLEGSEQDRRSFPPRQFYPGEGVFPLESNREGYAWMSGCCLAMRRSVFEQVGGFDEGFFLYGEDTDLCLRTRQAGWRIAWLPQVEVLHSGRQSQSELSAYQRHRNLFRGVARFCEKHYAPPQTRSIMRVQFIAASLASALILLAGRSARGEDDPFHLQRLRARRDTAREWLAHHSVSPAPFDRHTPRILKRLTGLLVQGLREGRYPLDDF